MITLVARVRIPLLSVVFLAGGIGIATYAYYQIKIKQKYERKNTNETTN
jgi:hypothetical protein